MELIRKIFGWVLLLVGIAIISYSLYSSYNIFTAKSEVPEIFKIAEVGKEIPAPPKSGKQTAPDLQAQMEQMAAKTMSEQLQKFLPADFLPKLFNLFAWSILAGILIFGGTQIAGLGIKLIR